MQRTTKFILALSPEEPVSKSSERSLPGNLLSYEINEFALSCMSITDLSF